MMHSPLLLGLSSLTLEVNDGLQSLITQVILHHLLSFRIYLASFVPSVSATWCSAVAVRSPVGLVGVLVVRVPVSLLLVLARAGIVEV